MPDVSHSPSLAEVAANKAAEFLTLPLLKMDDKTYNQGVLLQVTVRYLRHRSTQIDATHPPLTTEQMAQSVEAMFKALCEMKEKQGNIEANLQILRDSIPKLPYILEAVEKLTPDTEEEKQLKVHMVDSIKKIIHNINDVFNDMLQSHANVPPLVASDGRKINPRWPDMVAPRSNPTAPPHEEEEEKPSFSSLAAQYPEAIAPSVGDPSYAYPIKEYTEEVLLKNLQMCFNKTSKWQDEGTLPPHCPTPDTVEALGAELQQFNKAINAAAGGRVSFVERIFIGNLPHIIENYQLTMREVLDAMHQKGESSPVNIEQMMDATNSIKAHFLEHFSDYLKDEAIAPSRA